MKMNTGAEAVVRRLKEQELTLATAESCTGGLIGKLLPMMSAFSAGTSSCAAMRLASFPSSDRHNPTMPLKKRTIRVSMMRS